MRVDSPSNVACICTFLAHCIGMLEVLLGGPLDPVWPPMAGTQPGSVIQKRSHKQAILQRHTGGTIYGSVTAYLEYTFSLARHITNRHQPNTGAIARPPLLGKGYMSSWWQGVVNGQQTASGLADRCLHLEERIVLDQVNWYSFLSARLTHLQYINDIRLGNRHLHIKVHILLVL